MRTPLQKIFRHDDFEPKGEKREWIKSTESIQEPSIEVKRTTDIDIQPLNLKFEKDGVKSKTLKEHGEIGKQSKETPNLPSKNLTHMQVISDSQDGQIPEYIESKSSTNRQTANSAKKFEQLGRKSSEGLKSKDFD